MRGQSRSWQPVSLCTMAPKPPEFHRTARELQTCTFEGPGLQEHHQNSTRRHPEREKKRTKWELEREKKERNFGRSGGGGRRRGGPASGGLAQGGPGESKPTTTTTKITTTTRTPAEMEGGGQTQNECGPKGSGLPLPGFRVWVCRVWGSGLNVSLWVFGVWASWVQKFGPKH